MPETNIAIIGAGVVGLAIARELARTHHGVFVFERARTYGLETSSRNSQVIHGGIYYPANSLKARLCVEGRARLYQFCEHHGIPHRRLGKVIVAVNAAEERQLQKLYAQGHENGVSDLEFLSAAEVKCLEPAVHCQSGLMSPSTGILDAHAFMAFLFAEAKASGAEFAFQSEVIGIEKSSPGYRLSLRDREGESLVTASTVINAAGLASARVAALAGIDVVRARYALHFCKGEYFSVAGIPLVSHLVYPVPEESGLGIHVTLDTEGKVRLGPNARYVDTVDYTIDEAHRQSFWRAVARFLPSLQLDNIAPDFAGVRPKLQGPADGFRDFVIADEAARGLPSLINLIGIESPGLTAALAIASYVAEMLE